jgi:hypothetical protein
VRKRCTLHIRAIEPGWSTAHAARTRRQNTPTVPVALDPRRDRGGDEARPREVPVPKCGLRGRVTCRPPDRQHAWWGAGDGAPQRGCHVRSRPRGGRVIGPRHDARANSTSWPNPYAYREEEAPGSSPGCRRGRARRNGRPGSIPVVSRWTATETNAVPRMAHGLRGRCRLTSGTKGTGPRRGKSVWNIFLARPAGGPRPVLPRPVRPLDATPPARAADSLAGRSSAPSLTPSSGPSLTPSPEPRGSTSASPQVTRHCEGGPPVQSPLQSNQRKGDPGDGSGAGPRECGAGSFVNAGWIGVRLSCTVSFRTYSSSWYLIPFNPAGKSRRSFTCRDLIPFRSSFARTVRDGNESPDARRAYGKIMERVTFHLLPFTGRARTFMGVRKAGPESTGMNLPRAAGPRMSSKLTNRRTGCAMCYADTDGNRAFCYCGWNGEYATPRAAEAGAAAHQNRADDDVCADGTPDDDANVTV